MDRLKRIGVKRALVIALALITVLGAVLVLRSNDPGPGTDRPQAGGLPTDSLSSVAPSAGASGGASNKAAAGSARVLQIPNGPRITFAAQGGPGFVIKPAPSYRLTMTAQSSRPIGSVGYLVPTSNESAQGVDKNVGSSWSRTTTVTGRPAYAVMFVQAGEAGAAITCTISINGRVADSRATKGPYGRQVCYA